MSKGHQSVPNVLRPTDHDSQREPSRAYTFPSNNMMASTAHDTSAPEFPGVSPPFNGSPNVQTQQCSSRPESVVAADTDSTGPTSRAGRERFMQQMPFGQQFSANLLDLGGLIYPSENPFAYGNQPLSILEDAQMMAPEQHILFARPTSAFGAPISSTGQANVPFSSFSSAPFATSQQQQQQQAAYSQDRPGPTPMPRRSPLNFHIPLSSGAHGMGNTDVDEGLWQQMGKERTGLTPGVNLDDLFGSDGGWNSVYMDQGLGKIQ